MTLELDGPPTPTSGARRLIAGRYRLDVCIDDSPSGPHRWQATDTVLTRPVIVTLLGLDQGTAHRMVATSCLAHPNIADVYDTGTDPAGTYLVTERPRGQSLRAVLQRNGPLTPGRSAAIGAQIGSAVAAAHRCNLTHGGLTLDQITLADDDTVKVTGFADLGTSDGDVRAAAAVIYELVCGHPPDGRILDPPRRLRPGVPPALDRALVGALAPDGSWSAEQLAAALSQIDSTDDARPEVERDPTPAVGVTPLPRGSRRTPAGRFGTAAAVLLVVGALAVAVAVVASNGGGSPSSGPGIAPLPITSVAAFPDNGHDNDLNLPLVHDGNPATVWSTKEYASAQFGHIKPGVGIVLTLANAHDIADVVIASPHPGWRAQVYVAAQPTTTLAGWGAPAATVAIQTTSTTVSLHHAHGGAVLLWIADLGPPNPKSTLYPYRVDIGELTVDG